MNVVATLITVGVALIFLLLGYALGYLVGKSETEAAQLRAARPRSNWIKE